MHQREFIRDRSRAKPRMCHRSSSPPLLLLVLLHTEELSGAGRWVLEAKLCCRPVPAAARPLQPAPLLQRGARLSRRRRWRGGCSSGGARRRPKPLLREPDTHAPDAPLKPSRVRLNLAQGPKPLLGSYASHITHAKDAPLQPARVCLNLFSML